ncbi:MAG: DegT/DnrJ/EryC1/StrS family aminotransferase, partial [Lentisphaerae bacterium]|nr:DegT/DnrJ/EryC1/StrS family aminotransferase [Lentisphaerota bacterium]
MSSAGKIPLIDLQKQYAAIAGELEADVLEVLRSCAYVAGKRVAAFEREFAEAHQVRQCAAVGTGTDALHLILWALDFRPGDEALVPVNTYIATAEAVCLRGARPVFVDHDRFYNLAVEQLAARVTPKTRAVMAVHLYGQPARLDEILAFAKPRGLAVIEDCAQA